MSDNDNYRNAYSRLQWIPQLETDFNRPAKMNDNGNLEWFGRMFAYSDRVEAEVGELVFIVGGDHPVDGTPGVLGRITRVDPEIKHGRTPFDNWNYVRAEQVDFEAH